MSSNNLAFSLYHSNETFLDLLFSSNREHGGGYLTLILTKFLSSNLSSFFHIHIADFIGSYLGFLKGLIFSFFCFSFAKSLSIYVKSKGIVLLLYLFICILSYHIIYAYYGYLLVYDNTSFFRFVFPMTFYFIYFTSLYKYILNSKISSKYKYPIVIFLLINIILATNLEIIAINILLFYLFLIFHNFIVNRLINNCIYIKEIRPFYLNKIFYISFISVLLFSFLFFFLPSTQYLINLRVDYNLFSYQSILSLLKPFLINNCMYYITFLVAFIVALIFSIKRKESYKTIYFFYLFLSIQIPTFLLIFTQKQGVNYLDDGRIIFCYKSILLYLSLFLIFYIIKQVAIRRFLVNLLCFYLLSSSIYLIFDLYNNFNKYKYFSDQYYLEKQKNYIQEKMYKYYSLNNMLPYIDKLNVSVNTEEAILWKPSFDEECYNSDYDNILIRYYFIVYKKDLSEWICYSDSAVEKFYSNGGYFTKEELDNVIFNNLYDNENIYNAEGNKIPLDELLELMKKPIIK